METRFDVANQLYNKNNVIQRKLVSLSQLTSEEPCYGTSATAITRTDESQPKYIRITDFDDYGIEENHQYMAAKSYSEKHLLQPNDVLFARTGATVGKTYFYDGTIGAAVFAGYCIRFRFDNKKVLPKYVYWCTKTNSYLSWVKGIQRPSGQPNINKEEYKSYGIILPDLIKQEQLTTYMDKALKRRNMLLDEANHLISIAKNSLFTHIGLFFEDYKSSLFSFSHRGDLRELGIYCNPHSNYLNDIFTQLRKSDYYVGHLEDFVEINPKTSRKELQPQTQVSFVPMTAVTERTNEVVYELRNYEEVKSGFTIFQKEDLLWAKITPCMQNGKSFIASYMPTEIGFGSTEFHVLRAKDKNIYMPYLWTILSDEKILEAAQGMFGGSAGQQRVPDTFLKKFPIVLPPYKIQVELADKVFEALNKAKVMRENAEQEWQKARIQFEKELLGDTSD